MKKIILLWTAMLSAGFAMSQKDTTNPSQQNKVDTIRIGGMIIIKKNDKNKSENDDQNFNLNWERKKKRRENIETRFMLVDLGFSNFTNKTNFSTSDAKSYAKTIRPGETAFTSSDFKLKNFKSRNINIWFFQEKRNLINHVFNLKYGLGLELNNYHWENNLTFVKSNLPYVFRDSVNFSTNKLALDYLTVPLMLNFTFNQKSESPVSVSFGGSFGYLYSGRIKQHSSERGKQKVKSAFDTKDWKFSYVGELGLGKLRLYGSYVPQNIFNRGLDFRPFNFGIRIGGFD